MGQDNYIDKLETAEDKEREEALRDRVARKWKVDMKEIPSTYCLDWAIARDEKIVAWVEAKCRKHIYGKYPTYMIAMKKWNAFREFNATSHLKGFLIVEFTDGDYWLDTADVEEQYFAIGGRKDRNLKKDLEPCVFFDIKYFKRLK